MGMDRIRGLPAAWLALIVAALWVGPGLTVVTDPGLSGSVGATMPTMYALAIMGFVMWLAAVISLKRHGAPDA